MKYHSPEPIALGSGLFFAFKFLIYIKSLRIYYYNNLLKNIKKGICTGIYPFLQNTLVVNQALEYKRQHAALVANLLSLVVLGVDTKPDVP